MIKVIFFNVGQGDSILIDATENETRTIAIIDCKTFSNTNPVLEYLVNTQVEKINYCILTHPHTDHYSGFIQLLTLAQNNKIELGHFVFSRESTDCLNSLVGICNSRASENALQELYSLIFSLHGQQQIKAYSPEPDRPGPIPIVLGKFYLKFLSPTINDIAEFKKNAIIINSEEEDGNNSRANWLSTITALYNDTTYVLFTADANLATLDRVAKNPENKEWLDSRKLILAQVPHHGARPNHYAAFWEKRNKVNPLPVVISFGQNSYNHPNQKTVKFFMKNNYSLFTTNDISEVNDSKQKKMALNVFSNLVVKESSISRSKGHKMFVIENDTVIWKTAIF